MSADLDKAIDRAVREMLDVEPPAGLRGRVLDRLERPRRGAGWMWIVAPIAAAAVIVLAVLLPWRSNQADQPVFKRGGDIRLAIETRAPAPTPDRIAPPARPPQVASRLVPANSSGTVVAAAAVADDTNFTAIEALSAIAPIEVTPIAAASIAPREIVLRPLTPIIEVQIAPLTPPGGRD
jgi:hypothetical protein